LSGGEGGGAEAHACAADRMRSGRGDSDNGNDGALSDGGEHKGKRAAARRAVTTA